MSAVVSRGRGYVRAASAALRQAVVRRKGMADDLPPVHLAAAAEPTDIDAYWAGHTVRAPRFLTRRGSMRFLEWRFSQYPLFREFTGLWGTHHGDVILDHGCGPGNDLTGLALYSGARRLIGVDVSEQALTVASQRLALHDVPPERVELLRVSDADSALPLEGNSVDYALSLGVLHHTSDPAAELREIYRVLKSGGRACVMVYNRNSVWFHLYTAYERMVRDGAFAGLDVHEAFARNTDGPECPISRSYEAADFIELCRAAGFEATFVGGYLSRRELRSLKESWATAIADERLDGWHTRLLRALTFDADGFPMHEGYHAGIGGVYHLRKEGNGGPLSSPSRSGM
jgi:ubiquinone/menaquinone biosynthesis C-methylase UbiE